MAQYEYLVLQPSKLYPHRIWVTSSQTTVNDYDGDDDDDNNNNNNNNNKVAILWNQQVRTDRTIPNNKPDIIITDNEKRTCILIDVTISGDSNVIKKEAEKTLKSKDLTIEI